MSDAERRRVRSVNYRQIVVGILELSDLLILILSIELHQVFAFLVSCLVDLSHRSFDANGTRVNGLGVNI